MSVNILILGYLRHENILSTVLFLNELNNDIRVYLSVDRAKAESKQWRNTKVIEVAKRLKSQGLIEDYNILDSHKGCYRGVYEGVTWFLDLVEKGLILEDDLEIHPDLLSTYKQLIGKFDEDKQLGSISFYSDFIPRSPKNDDSNIIFCLSRYFSSWGWATTRDRWLNFEHTLDNLKDSDMFRHGGVRGLKRWKSVKERILKGELDSWAYRWLFTHWIHDWKTLRPYGAGLIMNSGFDHLATHTSSARDGNTGGVGKLHTSKGDTKPIVITERLQKDLERHILKDSYGIRSFTNRLKLG